MSPFVYLYALLLVLVATGLFNFYVPTRYRHCTLSGDDIDNHTNNSPKPNPVFTVYFTSFADPAQQASMPAFERTAHDFYPFHMIYPWTESRIDETQTDFLANHSAFLRQNQHYGFGLWKPFVIHRTLQMMPLDAYLLYTDFGCAFSKQGKQRFQEYLLLMHFMDIDLLVFRANSDTDLSHSKADLGLLLNVSEADLQSRQILTRASIWRRSDATLALTRTWLETLARDNYHYVDETLSTLQPEHPLFVRHNYDQAAFSLLLKKNSEQLRTYVLDYDETWPAPDLAFYPMHFTEPISGIHAGNR
jgi:hypothetical protein